MPLSPSAVPLLLDWYRQNRRDLPWRASRDPYPVLVSEIMLQQTRAETVKPYFHRSIACGISKVNIFTDLCLAGNKAMAEGLAAGEAYLTIRNRKVAEMKLAVIEKMALFGCTGKA